MSFSHTNLPRTGVAVLAALLLVSAAVCAASTSAQGGSGASLYPAQYAPNVTLYYGPQYPSKRLGATSSVYDADSKGFVACSDHEIICGAHGRIVVKKKRNMAKVALTPSETILSIHYGYAPVNGYPGFVDLPLKGLRFPLVTEASLAGQVFTVRLSSLEVEIYDSSKAESKPPDEGGCNPVTCQ
jgi:hypothetical protein